MKSLKSYFYFIILTWKQDIISRREFMIRFFLNAANSLTLFSFWIIYIEKFQSINGWTLDEIAVLYATTHMVMGWLGLFGIGSLDIVYSYLSNQISREFTDPGYPMLRLIANRVSFHSFSSLILGFAYFAFSTIGQQPVAYLNLLLMSAFGALIMILYFTVLNCWIVRLVEGQVLADQVYEVTLLFMMYPKALFSGLISIVCFSIVPIFWMVHYPADFVLQPSVSSLLYLILVVGIGLILAKWSLRSLKSFVLENGDYS